MSEVERLENQYEILKIVLDGRNSLVPWSKQKPPQKILDLATGTGSWAIDMADEFPEAEIVGTDLSPIQHDLTPPNVQFIIDDAYVVVFHHSRRAQCPLSPCFPLTKNSVPMSGLMVEIGQTLTMFTRE